MSLIIVVACTVSFPMVCICIIRLKAIVSVNYTNRYVEWKKKKKSDYQTRGSKALISFLCPFFGILRIWQLINCFTRKKNCSVVHKDVSFEKLRATRAANDVQFCNKISSSAVERRRAHMHSCVQNWLQYYKIHEVSQDEDVHDERGINCNWRRDSL